MAFLSRAITALERRGAPGYLPWGDSTPLSNSMTGGQSAGGFIVNEKSSLQVTAVYGSVSVIAGAVASLPLDLMTSPHRRNGKVLPPSPLLQHPYAEISAIDWWTQFTLSLALRGNFYGQIVQRDPQTLFPLQIKPVHPDHVAVGRLVDGTIEYRYWGQIVPKDQVIHVKLLSVPEALTGLNPVEYLRTIIGGALAADNYANSFFQNSALPSAVIETPEDYDEEEVKAWARAWKQMHQGTGQSQGLGIITGGATLKPITITPAQAQFLQSRQYSAAQISGQIFRVPPHMIGIVDRTTSWGTGIEQQEMGFVRNTLIDYIARGEQLMTACHPPGQFVRFDLSERLRGDKLSRFQANALGVAGGFLLPDEARADEDLPPLPGGIGKTALAPINATTLKQMATESVQSQQQKQNVAAGQSGDQPQQP